MSIPPTAPGATFEATFSDFPTGLVGTFRVAILDNVGGTLYGPSSAGVLEIAQGVYAVTLTAPTSAGQYSVTGDRGPGTAAASEDLVVTSSAPSGGLPSGIDLCTLADVRAYLQKPGGEVGQDAVVQSLITRASRLIASYASREFTPTASATRRFRVDGQLVDLWPFDLRTVSSITLHPEATSPTVVAASSYAALPANGSLGGTYLYLRLGASLSLGSSFSAELGYAQLDVAGAWGMASIPDDVRQAAIVTVSIWMRREVQAFSTTFNIDEARLERPEALPSAVRAMLAPYRRVTV